MSVLDNFEQWKDFLGDRLHQAEDQGVDHATINNLAYQVGEHLATKVDAHNDEEAMLRDLWNVASEEERKSIASMMVKLVQNEGSDR
ncbi:DUF3243 domain-containing protein [Alkalibacillus haloalkaliphilus]|uniref:DUF3243 domain-containing protein n=1 Tax=Alkalibacillus haloalkaliphilus TaxID=94136 RepID=UPI0029356F9A|nr:DUF3243 domain-containing protein [Alkalibacillus haloalkaliphilus]MDV2580664.1 DUF3243 domain-containing protein [Alkalibacillus haloalkaliphilus]